MSSKARHSLILIAALLLMGGASYLTLRPAPAASAAATEPETTVASTSAYDHAPAAEPGTASADIVATEPETTVASTSAYDNANAAEPGTASADTISTEETSSAALPAAAASHYFVLVQQWRTSTYYDLSIDREFTVEDGLGGYNIIRIKNGAVEVTEANCPDLVCVYSLPLSEPGYGGLIACMPHALYITVVTEDEVPKDLR